MKKSPAHQLLFGLAIAAALTAANSANATFEQGAVGCENAVAEQFPSASMADITASTPYHKSHSEARIDWSVTTEDESAMGYCKVNRGGIVLRMKVEHHKRYHRRPQHEDVIDGMYYDRHSRNWRMEDTDEVCHTCTPENGFPRHGH
jgi:hypothetical protein